jgi:WD40 repeat protein
MSISPDGKRVAARCKDNKVRVWDAETGAELMALEPEKWAHFVAFSQNGQYIASYGSSSSGTAKGIIQVWDAKTGAALMTLRCSSILRCVAFSPDGKHIAAGTDDGTVKVWELLQETSNEDVMVLTGQGECANSVAFSSDGRRLIADQATSVTVWDLDAGQEVMTVVGSEPMDEPQYQYYYRSVAFSPDGRRFVAVGRLPGTIDVWDALRATKTVWQLDFEETGKAVSFSPNSKLIAVAAGQIVKICDTETVSKVVTIREDDSSIKCVSFGPNSHSIVTGSSKGKVKTWDVETGSELMTLRGHEYWVSDVAFSPDGRYIASTGVDSKIRLWDAKTGSEVLTFAAHRSRVNSIAFSYDSTRLVSGSDDGTVKLWDVDTGIEVITLYRHKEKELGVSLDPQTGIMTSEKGSVTGADTVSLFGMQGVIKSVTFSLDGKCIAASGLDGTVKVWKAASQKEVKVQQETKGR